MTDHHTTTKHYSFDLTNGFTVIDNPLAGAVNKPGDWMELVRACGWRPNQRAGFGDEWDSFISVEVFERAAPEHEPSPRFPMLFWFEQTGDFCEEYGSVLVNDLPSLIEFTQKISGLVVLNKRVDETNRREEAHRARRRREPRLGRGLSSPI